MNFFSSHDWLGRELESYAFKLDHLLFILIAMAIGVVLALVLRKREKKTIKIVLISLWILYLVVVWTYYGYNYIMCAVHPDQYPFNLKTMLPLHSCCMFMFVFPFAIFVENKIVKTAASSFLVIINMIMGFITLFVGCPPGGYSALSFPGMSSLIYHAIDVIVPLIMVVTKFYDIQKKDFIYGLILFGALALTVWIFDAITGSDYFYIYDGSNFPVLKVISTNVPAIVWTLITVSCYAITGVAIHFLIIGIKYLIEKKKQKTE